MGSTRTLAGVSIEALKSALAVTTRVEVLLEEVMATEVLLEEGISQTAFREEEEVTLKSNFTNIKPQWIKAIAAPWEPLKAQLIQNGITIRMKIFITIITALDMAIIIILITDNQKPFEKISSRHHQQ